MRATLLRKQTLSNQSTNRKTAQTSAKTNSKQIKPHRNATIKPLKETSKPKPKQQTLNQNTNNKQLS